MTGRPSGVTQRRRRTPSRESRATRTSISSSPERRLTRRATDQKHWRQYTPACQCPPERQVCRPIGDVVGADGPCYTQRERRRVAPFTQSGAAESQIGQQTEAIVEPSSSHAARPAQSQASERRRARALSSSPWVPTILSSRSHTRFVCACKASRWSPPQSLPRDMADATSSISCGASLLRMRWWWWSVSARMLARAIVWR